MSMRKFPRKLRGRESAYDTSRFKLNLSLTRLTFNPQVLCRCRKRWGKVSLWPPRPCRTEEIRRNAKIAFVAYTNSGIIKYIAFRRKFRERLIVAIYIYILETRIYNTWPGCEQWKRTN